ncbi:MAG: hypothetical protein G01um101472_389, partial [Parcubacteria group bacterium Gr01-1014_72]
MEHLTKQQVILLALLVSFVTSIATGIVTVSLVNQAPSQVTQTISRVVEKTIEKVVPAPTSQGASVITKETVVVKADDAVISSVERGTESLVRVKKILGASSEGKAQTMSLGLIISKSGLIVADRRAAADDLDELGAPIPRTFFAELAGGEKVPLVFLGADAGSGVALFKMSSEGAGTAPKGKVPPLPVFTETALGNSLLLKLGQTVIALGGESDNAVSVGIVSSIAERSVTGAVPVADVKEENGALDYTIIVATSASEPAPLQYLAPFADRKS